MTTELKERGFVHLTDQTEAQLQIIVDSLGETIMTTDVIVKAESKGLVTTSNGIDFHTDHHKAKYVVWYCYKQTDRGGESLILDAEKIYLALPLEIQEKLKSVNLFEHKIFSDDKDSYPFVDVDNSNTRQFHCSLVNDTDKENPAYIFFRKVMSRTIPVKIKLAERDILIIDNYRMFHGRTPIIGTKDRYLKRYWIKSKTINHNN